MFDNFLQLLPLLRAQNGLMGNTAVNPTPDDPDINGGLDINKRLGELYHPQTSASDALNANMTAMPQRADYQRGKLAKIGAVIAGMGAHDPATGFNVASGILNAPYDNANADWLERNKALQFGASEETRNNNVNRQMAEQTIGREIQNKREDINQSRLDETTRNNKAKEDQKNQQIEIQRQRSEAYIWKQTHPQYDGKVDSNGMLVYVNKTDPSDIVHTQIDTGKMNDFDKIKMGINGRLSEIAAQGKNQEELEGTKAFNRMDLKREAPGVNPNTKGGTDTQTETTIIPAEKDGGILGSGIGANVITPARKVTVTHKKPVAAVTPVNTPNPTDQNRQKAIDYLNTNKKPVTEANIKYIMDQMGGK